MGLRTAREEIFFLSRWLRAPLKTGSVRPSGRDLTRLIAGTVADLAPDEWIVELGGGTGAVTRALIENGIAPDRMVVLERDRALSDWLRSAFPEVTVVTGDAEHLRRHLASNNAGPVRRIVSSLPLLSLPRSQRNVILAEAFAVLGENGSLIQYSYGPSCPVSRTLRDGLGINAKHVGTAWRNLPPARVWEFKKQDSEQAARPGQRQSAA
ncbi:MULTISPECIES: class I SAM-dependent methyltransferase [Nisaea]|uniref:class I SAM-dependent methyltransferase n=1 Tax=Nisaea TaxID=390876 RepID=UPI00040F5BB0|nr:MULTISPECIES: rRNA adenine N-6-methyltransferase family protein [Nisaea]